MRRWGNNLRAEMAFGDIAQAQGEIALSTAGSSRVVNVMRLASRMRTSGAPSFPAAGAISADEYD
jgi:hypothetical protein